MIPLFPIYIVSKGRANSFRTPHVLDALGVPYTVIVEGHEYDLYANFLDRTKLLVLDKAYHRDYQTCDEFADTKSKGPGPARNFAWDHAMATGAQWHWVMDDNIREFLRLNRNQKYKLADGVGFRCMENFVLRYKNVALAGPNYTCFAKQTQKLSALILNTRIYSCLLIRNDLPYRWRGRYNEDSDLSLRVLKDRWCTILFNAFLQDKGTTQTMPGGNTEAFYATEGTLPKSRMLVKLHPDVTHLVWKFGRWHHHVDYRPFKANKLVRRSEANINLGVNNYGMKLARRAA